MSDWDDFSRALTGELARLPLHGILQLTHRGQPWHLAQFVQNDDHLRAEVGGELADTQGTELPTGPGVALLESLRWRPHDPTDTNWWRELPWPAVTAEYDELVAAVVGVLRDLNGVPAPADLVYRAWEISGRQWPVDLPGVAPATAADDG